MAWYNDCLCDISKKRNRFTTLVTALEPTAFQHCGNGGLPLRRFSHERKKIFMYRNCVSASSFNPKIIQSKQTSKFKMQIGASPSRKKIVNFFDISKLISEKFSAGKSFHLKRRRRIKKSILVGD